MDNGNEAKRDNTLFGDYYTCERSAGLRVSHVSNVRSILS